MCPAPSTAVTKIAVARAAQNLKRGTGSAEAVEDARRNHAAAKLEEYVQKVVADWPPLTDEQRARVAALLRREAS